ncbi:hypothetical protein BAE44_0025974, partial [Dichanthelium oligosanthes]
LLRPVVKPLTPSVSYSRGTFGLNGITEFLGTLAVSRGRSSLLFSIRRTSGSALGWLLGRVFWESSTFLGRSLYLPFSLLA